MVITLWLFNVAMENGPFIDALPFENDLLLFDNNHGLFLLKIHGFHNYYINITLVI